MVLPAVPTVPRQQTLFGSAVSPGAAWRCTGDASGSAGSLVQAVCLRGVRRRLEGELWTLGTIGETVFELD